MEVQAKQEEEETSNTSSKKKVKSIRMIFMYADAADLWLMTFGFIGAVGSGLSFAFRFLPSSRILNNMGNRNPSDPLLIHNTNKVIL